MESNQRVCQMGSLQVSRLVIGKALQVRKGLGILKELRDMQGLSYFKGLVICKGWGGGEGRYSKG